jgi:hypothetical protein
MSAMTATPPADPRAVLEYRVPAIDLKTGDLVNTSPGEDDWQQVIGVHVTPETAGTDEMRDLVKALGGRYVLVELTDLAPVDAGVYFTSDTAMVYATDDGVDEEVSEVISGEDGVRTYLYTKFELVTIRAPRG